MAQDEETGFDFIVAGGGSSGSVVAGRLAEAGHSVLVLDSGLSDETPFVRFPGAFVRLFSTKHVMHYPTTPQEGAGGRPLYICQSNTLGGGSSVNAMVYIRGAPQDFDDWASLGCIGWGWEDVLPVFKSLEANEVFSGLHHGVDGALKVSNAWLGHPTGVAFVKAGQEIGLPYNPDFNGARQAGVGFFQSTIDRARVERASAASCFMRPQMKTGRLTVRIGCRVLRLTLDGEDVTGVVYRDKTGAEKTVCAAREVILSAGALATPKILMLSGIGPANELDRLGLPVVVDAPDVGENFQNHVEVPIFARLKDPISLKGEDGGLKALKHGLAFTLFKQGLLSSNICEVGAFVDTAENGRPDIQLLVIPALFGSPEWPAPDGHGITICVTLLRPKSRGSVRLASADPDAPIEIDGGVLRDQDDVDALVRGIEVVRRMLKASSLAKICVGEVYSDPSGEDAALSPEAFVRKYVRPISHVSCTCRMGSDDLAVVDPELRVNGVKRLRVADASVMPRVTSGNTNSVAILIGEKCARSVLHSLN